MDKEKRAQLDREQVKRTADSFQNTLTRLGEGLPNLMSGTRYPLTRLTQNQGLMNSLYRNHWIVRRIVDTIPEDMCRNWLRFNTSAVPEDLRVLQDVLRATRTRQRLIDGLKWGRLYGGAAGVMLLKSHEGRLETPLIQEEVQPGDYRGLLILDRWQGVQVSRERVEDLSDPDFGLPRYYDVITPGGRLVRVHHSRVLRFLGDALPASEAQSEDLWGASVVEAVFDELKKRDNTSYNIANLVFLANLRIYKTEMVDLMGLATEGMQQDFYNVMAAMNSMMNSSGMSVIGKNDEFEVRQYSFGGIHEIYEAFMLDVAGACGIPATRLFGRSPAGMNATGESDLIHYYERIEEKQAAILAPILDKLLPVAARSAWGRDPGGLSYDFAPLKRPDARENAEVVKTLTEAVIHAAEAGLITPDQARRELKEMSASTGVWTNLT